MAEPDVGISVAIDLLKAPLIHPTSRTPPATRVRREALEKKVKDANLVRYNTLPEFISLSEEINRQAPSQFGWFDQKQNISIFREKLTILAEDKQMEMQLQQVELIDELERQSKAPISAKERFIKTVQKVINVNTFFSQIQRSIQAKELAPSYPRRSSFNGVSQYMKNPHLSKMADIIQSTKRKTWRQRIWNFVKVLRGVVSLPLMKVESLVESRFGSAAVSYFVLLQRLILLNFIIAIFGLFIWFPAVLPCPTVARNSSDNQTEYVSTCTTPVYNGAVVYPDSFSFLTLKGLDNTSLFLGSYRENGRWDYKSAYFYTFFLSTFTILVFISYLLGQAYIDTFSILNSTRNISFYMANIVFGGWTYTLASTFAANSEHKRLTIVLRETVWQCSPNYQTQRRFLFGLVNRLLPTSRSGVKDFVYICCLWFWRAILWAMTLALLTMGSALIVITALQRVCPLKSDFSFVYGFIPSLWHTFLELVFSILTAAELYNTQSKGMVSLLIKHLLMRLISLCSIFTVVVFLYILSKCEGQSHINFPLCFNSGSNSEPVNCLASGCWETEVAKVFHEYLVAQFISSIIIRSIMITLQNFIRIGVFQLIKRCSFCKRIPCIIIGLIKNFFSTPFHLPKHVIKLIYIQSLVWSGMLFCPFQHLIGFVGFLFLYISMFIFSMWNCRISSKQPRTARSNLVYYMILFAAFFFIMMVTHFPLFQFVPSLNCGPFSGTNYYYEFYKTIHLRWVSDLVTFNPSGNCSDPNLNACSSKLTLVDVNFWDSPAVGPLTVLTVGLLLVYFATIKKKNYEIVQLRKQILLLAIDRIFYVEGNAHFLSALSQKYLKDKKAQAAFTAAVTKKENGEVPTDS